MIFLFVLPAALGLVVGFVALAIAITNEPTIPVVILTLFSPGLKIAEIILPQEHGSLAWTFGWFLRIAIGVNAAFYFVLFFPSGALLNRRFSKS
jgi:hypothetical protein